MKLKLLFALSALTLSLSSYGNLRIHTSIPTGKKNQIIAGQLRIKLKPSVLASTSMLKSLPPGAKLLNRVGPLGWTLWSIPANLDPRAVAQAVRKDPNVLSAEPVNRIYLLIPDPNDLDWGVEERDESVVLNLGEGDPYFIRTWNLDETFALDAWGVYPNFQHIGILSLEFHVDKLSRPLL